MSSTVDRPACQAVNMSETTIARILLLAIAVIQLLAGWDRASDQTGWAIPSVFLVLAIGCGIAALAVPAL